MKLKQTNIYDRYDRSVSGLSVSEAHAMLEVFLHKEQLQSSGLFCVHLERCMASTVQAFVHHLPPMSVHNGEGITAGVVCKERVSVVWVTPHTYTAKKNLTAQTGSACSQAVSCRVCLPCFSNSVFQADVRYRWDMQNDYNSVSSNQCPLRREYSAY